MKAKIDEMKYLSIAEFEVDFNLMIANCLNYNNDDTIFHRAGLRMKEQGSMIIRSAQREAQEAGIEGAGIPTKTVEQTTQSDSDSVEITPKDIDQELLTLQTNAHAMVVNFDFFIFITYFLVFSHWTIK